MNKPVIAVASGKGGTGKTTVAVNLAYALKPEVEYLDADVEEPNGHIFLKPSLEKVQNVNVMVPVFDDNLCKDCGRCRKACQFNALVRLNKQMLVFPELCHGCGACILACPNDVIMEGSRVIGKISTGETEGVRFLEGRLKAGEAKAPPVINQLVKLLSRDRVTIIDVSPGSSCPVIEGIKKSDFVILVTEPTPFGLHDLIIAVEMVRTLNKPFGVIINRADLGNEQVLDYCQKENIRILMQIPFRQEFAELCSRGELLGAAMPELEKQFQACFESISEQIKANAVGAEKRDRND